MGNNFCNVSDICGEKNKQQNFDSLENEENEKNAKETTNNSAILNIDHFPLFTKENKSVKHSERLIPNLIDSYNAYNNFYFLLSRVTFLQKNIKLFLQRKKSLQKKTKNSSIYSNDNKNQTFSSNKNESWFKKIDYSFSPQHIYKNISNSTEIIIKNIKIPDESESLLYDQNPHNISINNSYFSKKKKIGSLISHYSNNISMKSEDGLKLTDVKGYFLKKNKRYKFEGKTEKGKKVGFGKVTWEDKSMLYAIFDNSKANGPCKFYDNKGPCFQGYYENNRPKGYGIYMKKCVTYEGIWERHNLVGLGIEIWKDETYYQGEFYNSMKKGIGLYRWPDGTIYQGEWENNQMNGLGVIIYTDERMYQGEIKNGVMSGFGEFIWGDKKRYIGYYKDNQKSGMGIFFANNNPLIAYIGFWDRGKMNGIGVKVNNNKICYGFWKEGKREVILQGNWMVKNYLKGENLKYLKLFSMSDKNLLKFLSKYA